MALAIDTLLPTPWGWTSVHDLVVGSVLLDELGYPCRVTEVSETRQEVVYDLQAGWGQSGYPEGGFLATGDQELYSITHRRFRDLRDPTKLIVPPDLPSNWPVWTRNEVPRESKRGRPAKPKAAIVNVQKVGETAVGRMGKSNYLQHIVPTTFPLHLRHIDLRVPPYVMGLLVNQYTTASGTFRTTRRFFEYYAAEFAKGGYILAHPDPNGRGYHPYTFLDCKVIGIDSHLEDLKFRQGLIPVAYLRGSAQQRMDLVAGLLDKHTISKPYNLSKTSVAYSTTSPALGLQVRELVRTLGFPAYMHSVDEERNVRRTIYWHPVDLPYKLPLYRNRYGLQTHRTGSQLERYVWKVYSAEKQGMHPVRSVSVDSPYGLFSVSELFFPMKGGL